MPRLLAIQIALFLLPLVGALLWRRLRPGRTPSALSIRGLITPLLAGFALLIASFVVLGVTGGGTDPGSYRPARLEGGVLVPPEVR